MSLNKYKIGIVDFSYLLSRNCFAASRGGIGTYNEGDIMRITLQTLNKCSRDYGITVDKWVMIYDKWDKNLGGYYRTWLLRDHAEYKGDRVYMTDEEVENMIASGNYTDAEIQKARGEAYMNSVKYKAKWGMISDFGKIGVPCFGLEGWEYDDLAWLISCMTVKPGEKKSVIITKDSDLLYSLSPSTDYFKLPTGGSSPQVITYDEMYDTIPEQIKNRGVSLYQYKSFLDSIGVGHNNMKKSKKGGLNEDEVNNLILSILDGDLTGLSDPELFKAQMNTFDLSHFPKLDEAKSFVTDKLLSFGSLGTYEDYRELAKKHGVTGISERYFTEFIGRLNPELYGER